MSPISDLRKERACLDLLRRRFVEWPICGLWLFFFFHSVSVIPSLLSLLYLSFTVCCTAHRRRRRQPASSRLAFEKEEAGSPGACLCAQPSSIARGTASLTDGVVWCPPASTRPGRGGNFLRTPPARTAVGDRLQLRGELHFPCPGNNRPDRQERKASVCKRQKRGLFRLL